MALLFQQQRTCQALPGGGRAQAAGRWPPQAAPLAARRRAAAWAARRRDARGAALQAAAAAAQEEGSQGMYSSPPGEIQSFGFKQGIGERYELGDKLGQGAFAVVRAATDKQTGER